MSRLLAKVATLALLPYRMVNGLPSLLLILSANSTTVCRLFRAALPDLFRFFSVLRASTEDPFGRDSLGFIGSAVFSLS